MTKTTPIKSQKPDEATKATKKANASRKWQSAKNKFSQAQIPQQGDLIDSVRVRIIGKEHEKYLQEIARKMQIHTSEVMKTIISTEMPMLSMSPSQLQKHELFYDKNSKSLFDNNIASTLEKQSKDIIGLQAFVMSKDGCLEYIGTHTGLYDSTTENLVMLRFYQADQQKWQE